MMYRILLVIALSGALLSVIGIGCGEDEGDPNYGDDTYGYSDADSDADGDADSDNDTDTNYVGCPSAPDTCEDIGETATDQYYGCCWNDVVYWCDGGALYYRDCTAEPPDVCCGYSSENEAMWCLPEEDC